MEKQGKPLRPYGWVRKGALLTVLLAIILWPSRTLADFTPAPLSIALQPAERPPGEAAADPEAVVREVLQSKPEWFKVAGSLRDADVVLTLRSEVHPVTKRAQWVAALLSRIAGKSQHTLPTLGMMRIFLLHDLQRIFLIKNLKSIKAAEIPVTMQLGGIKPAKEPLRLKAGDRVSFRIQSPQEGYLTLINVDCQGTVELLFPIKGESSRVDAGQAIEIPDPKRFKVVVKAEGPFGQEYVKAIYSSAPLDLRAALDLEKTDVDRLLKELAVQTHSPPAVTTRGEGVAASPQAIRIGTAELHFETVAR